MEKTLELTLIDKNGKKITKAFKDGYGMYQYAIMNRPKWKFELKADNETAQKKSNDAE